MENTNILVATDDQMVANSLGGLLKQLKYNYTISKNNYADVLSTLSTNQIKIILTPIDTYTKSYGGASEIDELILAYELSRVFFSTERDPSLLEKLKTIPPPIYLIKSYNKDDLYVAIELAMHNYQYFLDKSVSFLGEDDSNQDSFFIKKNRSFHRIDFDDILYIKSEHVYTRIYARHQKEHLIRKGINALSKELPPYFFRVHRSFIVNMKKIDIIHTQSISIESEEIPLGKNYRSKLLDKVTSISRLY